MIANPKDSGGREAARMLNSELNEITARPHDVGGKHIELFNASASRHESRVRAMDRRTI